MDVAINHQVSEDNVRGEFLHAKLLPANSKLNKDKMKNNRDRYIWLAGWMDGWKDRLIIGW